MLVEVASSVVVIVVVGRVVEDGLLHRIVCYNAVNRVQEVLIRAPRAFLLVGQAVKSHVLHGSASACCCEGIVHDGLVRNTSPGSGNGLGFCFRRIDRHTTFIEFLAIRQHILAHLAQVYIHIASIFAGCAIATGIDKGVHQPKLYVFDVGLFKVVGIQFAHHAAPGVSRVQQIAVMV